MNKLNYEPNDSDFDDYSSDETTLIENEDEEEYMTFIQAGVYTLEKCGKYMTCKDIWKYIETHNLVYTRGKTPKNSLSQVMHLSVKKKKFVHKKGKRFGLNKWKK